MWQRWTTTATGRRVSAIHLGHSDDRTTWTGLEHQSCNTSDGATRGNKKRAEAARTVTALPPMPPMRRW
jgi:hypothetical protein